MADSKTAREAAAAAAATTADADHPPEHARLFQTAVRESITPYLPPPVVKAMKEIDPRLEPLVGPEASVTIFVSFLLAWMLFQLLSKTVFSSGSSSLGSGTKNTAIQEDDRDKDILPSDAETSRPFDATVLMCGPSLGGKTSLFYRLLQQQRGGNDSSSTSSISSSTSSTSTSSNMMGTVRSIKSNTGFLDSFPNDDTGSASTTLRILDTPGHWGPQKLLRAVPLQEVQRLVVVVDSTQPVAPAADYLYAVLKSTILNGSSSGNGNGNGKCRTSTASEIDCETETNSVASTSLGVIRLGSRRAQNLRENTIKGASAPKGNKHEPGKDQNQHHHLGLAKNKLSRILDLLDQVERFRRDDKRAQILLETAASKYVSYQREAQEQHHHQQQQQQHC